MSEHKTQTLFFNWVRKNIKFSPSSAVKRIFSLFYAIPNGADVKPHERQRLKMEGMKSGVLDCCLPYKIDFLSLWLEFKYLKPPVSTKIQLEIDTGNRLVDLSPNQIIFREDLIKGGHKVVIPYSTPQAVRTVFDYLGFDRKNYVDLEKWI